MSPFEYISAFQAIVLGLATANVLTALASTIKNRSEISIFWVHTGWCLYSLFAYVALWFGMWEVLQQSSSITIFQFMLFFQWAIFLYVGSQLLRPDDFSKIDLEEYFFKIKTPFLICWAIPSIVGLVWLQTINWEPFSMVAMSRYALIGVTLIGVFTNSRRSQEMVFVLVVILQLIQEALQPGLVIGSGA